MERLFESNPTHFIEVFIGWKGESITSKLIYPIHRLGVVAKGTENFGCKTIAIFKITPKKAA